MQFDFSNTAQMQTVGLECQLSCTRAVGTYARGGEARAKAMRILALPIALMNNCIPVGATVATVGEAIIKGVGNIFISIRDKNGAAAWKGVKQLVVQAPFNLLVMTPIVGLGALAFFAVDTVYGIINPENQAQFKEKILTTAQVALNNATDPTKVKIIPSMLRICGDFFSVLQKKKTLKDVTGEHQPTVERISRIYSSKKDFIQVIFEELFWLTNG